MHIGRRETSGTFRCMKICSWNVRGVKEVCKKQAIFSMATSRDVRILCLQETHLDKDTVSALRNRNSGAVSLNSHLVLERGECTDKHWVGFLLQTE